MKNIFTQSCFLAIISFLLAHSACTYDVLEKLEQQEEDTIEAFLHFNAPASMISNGEFEKEIETIDVLVFKFDNDKEYFSYQTEATLSEWIKSPDPENINDSIRFKVSLIIDPDPSARFSLVFLANAKSELNKLGPIPISGVSKNAILSRIEAECDNIWDISIRPIPMWSETTGEIKVEEGLQIKELSFLRSLARVDIDLKDDIDNFVITDVYIYKPYTNGRITPEPDVLNASRKKVESYSLANESTRKHNIHYDNTWVTNGERIEESIYVFEAPALTIDTMATSLVIGGLYKDMPIPTYYRVDFREKDGGEYKYIDILRNYLYNIHITKVLEAGYLTPDSAYYSRAGRMIVDITTWNSEQTDVNIPGAYILNVTTSSIDARGLGYSGTIGVENNNPSGWELTGNTSGSWYTVTKENNTTIRVNITAGTAENPVIFNVKAGTLTKQITLKR